MNFAVTLPPQIRIYTAFFIYALALGAIYPRIGDMQLAMGIGEGALGAALIGPGVGAFTALMFAAPLLNRFSHRLVLLVGNAVLIIVIALATFSPNPLVLFAFLFCAGLAAGSMEVVVNLEADRIEHALGRRIMSRCHAFWSFGFFSAGLLGAIAKQFGVSPQVHVGLMVPLVIIVSYALLGGLSPAASRNSETHHAAPGLAAPSLGILGLVAFTLSAMFLEGAGIDWSVIFMRESFDVAPFINGAALAVGALAQAITRFFADQFVDRLGATKISRIFIATLGAGVVLVVLSPHPALALLGFALIGIGGGSMFPLAMSAAAQRTDKPAAQNIAALSQFAFVAFLIGPPALGFIAEHFGVRYAFAVCLPFVVLSWFAIRSLQPQTQSEVKS